MSWVTSNYARDALCQFIEKGFKKTENSQQNVVLLLFNFISARSYAVHDVCKATGSQLDTHCTR